jgi:hypothetical protein
MEAASGFEPLHRGFAALSGWFPGSPPMMLNEPSARLAWVFFDDVE